MDLLKRSVAWVLIMLMLNLYSPISMFAQEKSMSVEEKLTAHPMEVRATPKEEMEVEKVEKKNNWWLWGLLGAVIVGGAVAAGGSSGGGGDSGTDTGGIEGSW